MPVEEFVLSIIAIVMGSSVVILGITKFTELIKSWINRNKNAIPEEEFERLANAFIQYKKSSERRIQNLEAIISDEDGREKEAQQLEPPQKAIEIEDRETGQQRSQSKDNNNLRNMLRE